MLVLLIFGYLDVYFSFYGRLFQYGIWALLWLVFLEINLENGGWEEVAWICGVDTSASAFKSTYYRQSSTFLSASFSPQHSLEVIGSLSLKQKDTHH